MLPLYLLAIHTRILLMTCLVAILNDKNGWVVIGWQKNEELGVKWNL